MIYERSAMKSRIIELINRKNPGRLRIFEDTSEFMSIDAGDVIRLDGNDYYVLGNAREGRFSIDDQPKFWVKSSIDLETGLKKIIKMVFLETFDRAVGETIFKCMRSPEKEADVIVRMDGHPNFMHGKCIRDTANNMVRIIDFISGSSLYEDLRRRASSHREYYNDNFPEVMRLFIKCVEAISHMHDMGLHHGDIRADHIIIESTTGNYVWIDFDYEVGSVYYDVFCLGNVLLQVAGKGRHSLEDIRLQPMNYPDFRGDMTSEDMSLMFRHRVANLKKLFPYISDSLNEILMRFAAGTTDPYCSAAALAGDLKSLFSA